MPPQALKTISEANIIDQILQADAPVARRIEWLRDAVAALGNGPVYIKLDASHNRNHALIRAAFPETPWVFLYRDPVEVLVSQLAKPGRLSMTVPFEEFCLRGLEEIYGSGLEVAKRSAAVFQSITGICQRLSSTGSRPILASGSIRNV